MKKLTQILSLFCLLILFSSCNESSTKNEAEDISLSAPVETCDPGDAVVDSTLNLEGSQYFPLFGYETGPYQKAGTTSTAGFADYLELVNSELGGINGVPIVYEVLEYGYNSDKGEAFFCAAKQTHGADKITIVSPMSTGLTYRFLAEESSGNEIPAVLSIGYGLKGNNSNFYKSFFNTVANYPKKLMKSFETMLRSIGDPATLTEDKSVTFVNLYHNSVYGKETLIPFEILSSLYATDTEENDIIINTVNLSIPHGASLEDMQSAWDEAGISQADFVNVQYWGEGCNTVLELLKANGVAAENTMFGQWCPGFLNDEALSNGVKAVFPYSYNANTVMDKIKSTVYETDQKGRFLSKEGYSVADIGKGTYLQGVSNALLAILAIDQAQEMVGEARVVTAEEVKAALRNLTVTDEKLQKYLVMDAADPEKSILHAFETSCRDHIGNGQLYVHEYDKSSQNWVYNASLSSNYTYPKAGVEAYIQREATSDEVFNNGLVDTGFCDK